MFIVSVMRYGACYCVEPVVSAMALVTVLVRQAARRRHLLHGDAAMDVVVLGWASRWLGFLEER